MSHPAGRLSVLQLRVLTLEEQPDWPLVQILVDGREAFADVAPGWLGFDPGDLLGDDSPLLPLDQGRRVGLYRCTCGEAGCGVIAPVIWPSADGQRVTWTDFRNYTGVFAGPLAPGSERWPGQPWQLADLHFDRAQYVAEISRAAADGSWESPGRVTARLVAGGLRARNVTLPPGLRLRWAAPGPTDRGVQLSFERDRTGKVPARQQLLTLTSGFADPGLAAEEMLAQLDAVPVSEWGSVFRPAS